MHTRRAESVHSHRRAKRGLDAAGQAKHNTWEAIFLNVISEAKHAGEISRLSALFDGRQRPWYTCPAPRLAAPFCDTQPRFPGRQLDRKLAAPIEDKGRAVKNKL